MAGRPSDERRRELRRDYKQAERTAWLAALDGPGHEALLDYLDERLGGEECDNSLRMTKRWLAPEGHDVDEALQRYRDLGAGCDCEVLANLDPETRA